MKPAKRTLTFTIVDLLICVLTVAILFAALNGASLPDYGLIPRMARLDYFTGLMIVGVLLLALINTFSLALRHRYPSGPISILAGEPDAQTLIALLTIRKGVVRSRLAMIAIVSLAMALYGTPFDPAGPNAAGADGAGAMRASESVALAAAVVGVWALVRFAEEIISIGFAINALFPRLAAR